MCSPVIARRLKTISKQFRKLRTGATDQSAKWKTFFNTTQGDTLPWSPFNSFLSSSRPSFLRGEPILCLCSTNYPSHDREHLPVLFPSRWVSPWRLSGTDREMGTVFPILATAGSPWRNFNRLFHTLKNFQSLKIFQSIFHKSIFIFFQSFFSKFSKFQETFPNALKRREIKFLKFPKWLLGLKLFCVKGSWASQSLARLKIHSNHLLHFVFYFVTLFYTLLYFAALCFTLFYSVILCFTLNYFVILCCYTLLHFVALFPNSKANLT